jgi:hypothetical protein
MKCGHIADSHDPYGNPVCSSCTEFNNKADEIEKECVGNVGLEGRLAKCVYGDNKTVSRWELSGFNYFPENEFDEYYCGCYGWN